MGAITNLFRRIAATLRRSRLDDELREELAQHVAWKTESLIADGVPEGEARRRATVEVGNVTRLREDSRSVWGFPSLDSVGQDVNYALRQMRRTPVTAAVAVTYYARAAGPLDGVTGAVRDAMRRIDPAVPVFDLRTQDEQVERHVARDRFFALLGTALGAAALLLACIGLYGLLSYAIARRTPELGVRLALGASPHGLAFQVIKESLLLAIVGAAVGLPAAYALGRAAEASLFGVSPASPASPALLTAAVLVLAAVSAATAILPARRAARVDPLVALRAD
jgi:hypothetical protein